MKINKYTSHADSELQVELKKSKDECRRLYKLIAQLNKEKEEYQRANM